MRLLVLMAFDMKKHLSNRFIDWNKMDIHEYYQKMKDIQDIILKYIDDESQT